MAFKNIFFIFALLLPFVMIHCVDTASTNPSKTSAPAVPSDQAVTNQSAWVMEDAIWTLHNLYVAGKPFGSISLPNSPCPSGGTVGITGTLSYSDTANGRMEIRDLTYQFNNCKCSEDGGSIMFANGSARQAGNWITSFSQQMTYSGTATMNFNLEFTGYQDNTVDIDYFNCAFSLSEELWSGNWSTSGNMCGDSFSW